MINNSQKLTLDQFVVFVSWMWNGDFSSWKEDIWSSIEEFENGRTFQEGWPFCESQLVPRNNWWYITTSGTKLEVVATDESTSFSVEIPESRCCSGRTHYNYMLLTLSGLQYKSWYEYTYGEDSESVKIRTFWENPEKYFSKSHLSELEEQYLDFEDTLSEIRNRV